MNIRIVNASMTLLQKDQKTSHSVARSCDLMFKQKCARDDLKAIPLILIHFTTLLLNYVHFRRI